MSLLTSSSQPSSVKSTSLVAKVHVFGAFGEMTAANVSTAMDCPEVTTHTGARIGLPRGRRSSRPVDRNTARDVDVRNVVGVARCP